MVHAVLQVKSERLVYLWLPKDELASIPIFTRYKISSTYQSVIDVLILAYFFFVQVNIGKWRKTTSNHKRRVRILKYILITCVIE